MEGRIYGIQNVQKSLLEKLSGPKSDLNFRFFGLQPQRYRHLQQSNNINGYNKTKQQTESEFKFHHIKSFVVSPMIHSFQFHLEILQFKLQTLRELRSLHRNPNPCSHSHCGCKQRSMIKCCLQPTESNLFCIETIFESQVSCPSFHSCNNQSSHATFYNITTIIPDYAWKVLRFQNLSAVLICLRRKVFCEKPHILMYFLYVTLLYTVNCCTCTHCWCLVTWFPNYAALSNGLHQKLPNLVRQMAKKL